MSSPRPDTKNNENKEDLPAPELPAKLKQTGYKFNPKRIAEDVVYWDCENPKFYDTAKPENPLFSVWILSNTSKNVTYANRRFFEESFLQDIEVKIARIYKFNLSMSQKGLRSIYYEGQLVTEDMLPDCVVPRLGANVNETGLAVIRQLEAMDILVLNPISSIDLSRNKLYTMQLLASHNLPIPKTMIMTFPADMEVIRKEFSFPLVLKRASGSQGKGVMLVQSEEMLEDIADMLDSRSPLIFQEFIENSKGRDLRVWVMGGRCIGAMMRVASKGFKANIHQNAVGKSVKLSSAVEWLAIETSRILGLDMCGVDILIDKDTYKICEVNASPGYEGIEAANAGKDRGLNVPKQMLEFIKLRLGLWRKQSKKNKKFSVSIPVQLDHQEK